MAEMLCEYLRRMPRERLDSGEVVSLECEEKWCEQNPEMRVALDALVGQELKISRDHTTFEDEPILAGAVVKIVTRWCGILIGDLAGRRMVVRAEWLDVEVKPDMKQPTRDSERPQELPVPEPTPQELDDLEAELEDDQEDLEAEMDHLPVGTESWCLICFAPLGRSGDGCMSCGTISPDPLRPMPGTQERKCAKPECTVMFKPISGAQRYHHRFCRPATKPAMTRKCAREACGVVFSTRDSRKRYHHWSCRPRLRSKMSQCVECGVQFLPKTRHVHCPSCIAKIPRMKINAAARYTGVTPELLRLMAVRGEVPTGSITHPTFIVRDLDKIRQEIEGQSTAPVAGDAE